jgi:hypothetical protein
MPKLVPVDEERLKCSACDQLFYPLPVPRGARPWTPDEAKAKLAGEFNEHLQKAHFTFDAEGRSDTIASKFVGKQ